MTDNKKQDNIFFSIIEEDSGNTTDLDLNEISNLINYIDTDKNEISIYLTVNYKEKYTVKELLLICEYLKQIKIMLILYQKDKICGII